MSDEQSAAGTVAQYVEIVLAEDTAGRETSHPPRTPTV